MSSRSTRSASHKSIQRSRVLVEIGGQPGLFQDAVVVAHDLWLDHGVLATYLWSLCSADEMSLLLRAVEYDSDSNVVLSRDTSDAHLASACIPFQRLEMNCEGISEEGLASLCKYAPLRQLDISWCENITSTALQSVSTLSATVSTLSATVSTLSATPQHQQLPRHH